MRASRGMGCINPAKMPKGKVKQRRDNTDFTEYAEGGQTKSKVYKKKMASGGYTTAADGCCKKGKTRGKFV